MPVVASEALVVLAVLVVVAALEAVVLVAASEVVVPVAEALVAEAASKQNVSKSQGFVSFCKNNSDFACRYIII